MAKDEAKPPIMGFYAFCMSLTGEMEGSPNVSHEENPQ